jgi:hypothetical protein
MWHIDMARTKMTIIKKNKNKNKKERKASFFFTSTTPDYHGDNIIFKSKNINHESQHKIESTTWLLDLFFFQPQIPLLSLSLSLSLLLSTPIPNRSFHQLDLG